MRQLFSLRCIIPFLFSALLCAAPAATLAEIPRSDLPAPRQISPAAQARLRGFPRRISFQWSKVHGAAGYGIEIDHYNGQWASQATPPRLTRIDWVTTVSLDYDFTGDQPGAWRVWAMDKKGRPGNVSAWSTFSFGPENQLIPAPPPDTPPQFSRLPIVARTPLPLGKLRPLPLLDPVSGQPCTWPPVDQKDVIRPKPIYTPEPEFTDAARKAKAQGTVTLAFNVGEDGLVKRVCVVTASRDDLGLSAAKTVRTWRFEPAQKDGKPIAYNLSTEVDFHLY